MKKLQRWKALNKYWADRILINHFFDDKDEKGDFCKKGRRKKTRNTQKNGPTEESSKERDTEFPNAHGKNQ